MRRLPLAAARRASRLATGMAGTVALRVMPRRVGDEELAAALGHAPVAERLRGEVLTALPTVGDWVARLRDGAHGDVVAQADALLAHRFDLLGSGPVALGESIDWHADFKTGRRWPLVHPHLVRIAYGDGSDIKVPWELSRAQHLPVLAAAQLVTGDPRYGDEVRRQLEAWRAANPVGLGVNWACTMDVAIRAANWLAALAVLAQAGVDDAWLDAVAADLLLHARFIRAHPEYTRVRGNHYLADVAGLLVVASLFTASAEGRALAEWAAGELRAELELQVRPDGVVHEASIAYHRLVTEMFVCGFQALGVPLPERLEPALAFTAQVTREDGLTPVVGDADDGRFLPLGDYGADPRDHRHLFRQAGVAAPAPAPAAAYPDGGFYAARRGQTFLLVRCGDTGMGATGTHAHNDQLSFELAVGAQPVIVDPGSFAYTSDPAARNRFRSTAAHTVLSVDGREQIPLPRNLFLLGDTARAEALEWSADGPTARFSGRHQGFTPTLHMRTLELAPDGRRLVVTDRVEGGHATELGWTFTTAPGDARLTADGVECRFGDLTLAITAPAVRFTLLDAWFSPRFGVRVPTVWIRAAKRPAALPDETVFTLDLHG